MNVISLNEIPFKEKKTLVHNACALYKKMQLYKKFVTEKRHMNISDVIEDVNRQTFKSSSLFESLVEMLSTDHKMIIQKEFIDETESEWWKEYWSKSTYYKVMHEAIDNFLFLFYA